MALRRCSASAARETSKSTAASSRNTRAANSNRTPCLVRLTAAFVSSHSNCALSLIRDFRIDVNRNERPSYGNRVNEALRIRCPVRRRQSFVLITLTVMYTNCYRPAMDATPQPDLPTLPRDLYLPRRPRPPRRASPARDQLSRRPQPPRPRHHRRRRLAAPRQHGRGDPRLAVRCRKRPGARLPAPRPPLPGGRSACL